MTDELDPLLAKLPSPCPSKMLTLAEPKFGVARSCCPSPLKSPTAT